MPFSNFCKPPTHWAAVKRDYSNFHKPPTRWFAVKLQGSLHTWWWSKRDSLTSQGHVWRWLKQTPTNFCKSDHTVVNTHSPYLHKPPTHLVVIKTGSFNINMRGGGQNGLSKILQGTGMVKKDSSHFQLPTRLAGLKTDYANFCNFLTRLVEV